MKLKMKKKYNNPQKLFKRFQGMGWNMKGRYLLILRGPKVMVTLASMVRWMWPNVECNLKNRDSKIWPHKRWPAYCGNVEGVGLKQNNQSTTHIDPQVGTGGMVCVYYTDKHQKEWEITGSCLQCVWQRGKLMWKMTFKDFFLNLHKLCSRLHQSQVHCKTCAFSRLAATPNVWKFTRDSCVNKLFADHLKGALEGVLRKYVAAKYRHPQQVHQKVLWLHQQVLP